MDCLVLTSCWHWSEQVISTVIEFHLSNTSGSRRARTWIARLVDRDCAISPPPHGYKGGVCGILSPIWPQLMLTIRIKLWFRTSYLDSFYDKGWYDRVMMVSLLELLPIEAQKHHSFVQSSMLSLVARLWPFDFDC